MIKKNFIKRKSQKKKVKNKIKIAILGGSTTDLVKKSIEELLFKNKIISNIYESDYNQFFYEAVNTPKKLLTFRPQIIYLHTTIENIEEYPNIHFSKKDVRKLIDRTINKYKTIWKHLFKKLNCTIIQNNFELPKFSSLGSLDSSKFYGKTNYINSINLRLNEEANKNKNLAINDINLISSRFGLDKWHDDRMFFNYKYALGDEAIKVLSQNVVRLVLSILGKSKKCLIVDFDNTIWGGVIGEIGSNKIEIGNGSPRGEIFFRFQKYLLELKSKGVILAGCTKNEYNVAISGLKNKSCLLKEKDFTIIKANWNNKSENIREIAEKLNIGLDSMVFIDDSKFERELVKNQLPMVEVPEIGEEPENFLLFLDRLNYFESTNLSKEDIKRSDYYKNNVKREDAKAKFNNYKDYLLSLKMSSELKSFDNKNIERITQLINKTNQFNLTLNRMTLKEVSKVISDKNLLSVYGDLKDKFGNNGIVTALIGTISNQTLDIKLWVMSCRVFNRDLEFAVFDYLVQLCKKKEIKKICGNFFQGEKNMIAKNFYKTLGFKKITKNKWLYELKKKYKNKNDIIDY